MTCPWKSGSRSGTFPAAASNELLCEISSAPSSLFTTCRIPASNKSGNWIKKSQTHAFIACPLIWESSQVYGARATVMSIWKSVCVSVSECTRVRV